MCPLCPEGSYTYVCILPGGWKWAGGVKVGAEGITVGMM